MVGEVCYVRESCCVSYFRHVVRTMYHLLAKSGEYPIAITIEKPTL